MNNDSFNNFANNLEKRNENDPLGLVDINQEKSDSNAAMTPNQHPSPFRMNSINRDLT